VAEIHEEYLPWAGFIGEGLLWMMAEDHVLPAQAISSWEPLGSPSADIESCYAESGTRYVWLISSQQGFRHRPT
jgi:hypothetical protein